MLPIPHKGRYNSFVTQPMDLLSWFYVYLSDFDLLCNLIHHLASYPVSVRKLADFATPLSPLGITAVGLQFATLGGKYPCLDLITPYLAH